MRNIKLVCFDCDGVLVDSEYLASQIHAELMTEAGFPTTPEDVNAHYAGLNFIDVLKKLEKESGRTFSAAILDKSEQMFRERMKTDLHPVPGIRECVETLHNKLHLPYCICSNSCLANIIAMLKQTELLDLFEGRIFSATEVGTKKPKPAPDVYLFAAEKAGVKPEQCIVVEDSKYGAKAGADAGMRVIGFTGGRHAMPRLSGDLMEAGAETVIAHHRDLPATIEAMDSFKE